MITRQAAAPWVSPPTNLIEASKEAELPSTTYQEVVSREAAAAHTALTKTGVLRLSSSETAAYTDNSLKCPEKTMPYLVRALIGNRGTGHFFVSRSGTAIVISHGSLGHTSNAEETALVVCLSSQPSAVYGSISVAE